MYCDLTGRPHVNVVANGALTSVTYHSAGQAFWSGTDNMSNKKMTFSATGCSSIYQTGATVKPESYAVKWFIKYSG